MNTVERGHVDKSDPPQAKELRKRLVSHLEDMGELRSRRVRDALLRVPRHLFVSGGESLREAYANVPLPIGFGQTISQPAVVALMTEELELGGEERVLEIGTGSGYQSAVLSLLVREVYSMELFPELAEAAARRLTELGYHNVHVAQGDGAGGWPEHAPFDRVIATAAARAVRPEWIAQLSEGGILVAPVGGRGGQRLLRLRKRAGETVSEDLGWVAFVPMLPLDRRMRSGAP
jgi:protein-L-isoaspartate(D-aspartate) O-methyltransferase